jgi:hypothetical protein
VWAWLDVRAISPNAAEVLHRARSKDVERLPRVPGQLPVAAPADALAPAEEPDALPEVPPAVLDFAPEPPVAEPASLLPLEVLVLSEDEDSDVVDEAEPSEPPDPFRLSVR